jgi:hypothetical protein
LDKLHDSLSRLEGLQIHRRMQAGLSLDEAQAQSHDVFAQAHAQANSSFAVEATAIALEEAAQKNPVLMIQAKMNVALAKYQCDMRELRLKEVIHDLVPNQPVTHVQGIDIDIRESQLPHRTPNEHAKQSDRASTLIVQ